MVEISFDNLTEETKRKIQQVQIYEQNFQQILMEKRALTLELEELDKALKELEKNSDEVFKILAGQYVIKSSKEKLTEEILHKKEIFSLRIKNIEKQEKDLSEQIDELRQEIIFEINNNTKI